jgi:serine/threonine protein kinase
MMWTIHLLPRSKPTLTRLKALLRVSEFNTNVPTIVGYHPRGDQVAVVCKWVQGVSLRAYLDDIQCKTRPPISSFEATRLFRGFAHGLCQLHSVKAVAHGDIKPENLILSTKPHQMVMIDFGSAWILERMASRDRGDGESPNYTAPEVLNGGRLSFASDQFSATVVYYEMLTNLLPYHPLGALAGVASAGSIPAGSLKAPSRIAPNAASTPQRLWKQIDEIAFRGLEFDPGKRFRSGTEWRNRLDQLNHEMRAGNELTGFNKMLVGVIEAAARLFRR